MTLFQKILSLLLLGASLAAQAETPFPRLDATPRIAVVSAFAPELEVLLPLVESPRQYPINGKIFTTGTLQGQPVVLFISGVSMTNAAMTTQLALDRFTVSHIVFSGIAGGVNPALNLGDVAVPAQWAPYLEVLIAREVAPGKFAPPAWDKSPALPNYGMLHPRPVKVTSAALPTPASKSWFEVDPGLLARIERLKDVPLERCDATRCLTRAPRLVIGGNGVSGAAFVDNKAFREYAFATFAANVLDMETAAVGQVAYSNGVPYIALRSLSDLAGGSESENEMEIFMGIAAKNSARVLAALLAAW